VTSVDSDDARNGSLSWGLMGETTGERKSDRIERRGRHRHIHVACDIDIDYVLIYITIGLRS